MSGPILVGESNPYGADPYFALYPDPRTSAGGRMQRLVLGIKAATYIELDRYNLCEGRWSVPVARQRAGELVGQRPEARIVFVLLGRKVAAAFGLGDVPVFRVVERAKDSTYGPVGEAWTRLVLLPHPSGRNRMWQDPTTVTRCREVLGPLCPELNMGEVDGE